MSIRVLVVEDSAVVGEFLSHILNSDPGLRVVATVRNGVEALHAVENFKPDVITMDISMPVMDGYEATRRIMETHPTPIVIVSVSVDPQQVATTFRALEAGALAAVQKPVGIGHPDFEEAANALVLKVKLMSQVKVVRRWPVQRVTASPPIASPVMRQYTGSRKIRLIAMGASTGGPAVLQSILSEIPANFPIPIVIVQHMSPGFIKGFADLLSISTSLSARVAENGETLRPGYIYLAPDGFHMEIGTGGGIVLTKAPPENGMRPSVSYLFRSVAQVFGAHSVGVVLTGMGNDGAEGLKAMREKGAVTIAQDEASCIVFGMPAEAIRIEGAAHVFSPGRIASFLAGLDQVAGTTNP